MSSGNTDYDVIVVGSGFGGSVAALRLAEKGYRVLVLEAGRRFRDARPLALEGVDVDVGVAHRFYILKMPNWLSGIGAFSAAEIPSASTRRVSSGSMIPSSQRRAVE